MVVSPLCEPLCVVPWAGPSVSVTWIGDCGGGGGGGGAGLTFSVSPPLTDANIQLSVVTTSRQNVNLPIILVGAHSSQAALLVLSLSECAGEVKTIITRYPDPPCPTGQLESRGKHLGICFRSLLVFEECFFHYKRNVSY